MNEYGSRKNEEGLEKLLPEPACWSRAPECSFPPKSGEPLASPFPQGSTVRGGRRENSTGPAAARRAAPLRPRRRRRASRGRRGLPPHRRRPPAPAARAGQRARRARTAWRARAVRRACRPVRCGRCSGREPVRRTRPVPRGRAGTASNRRRAGHACRQHVKMSGSRRTQMSASSVAVVAVGGVGEGLSILLHAQDVGEMPTKGRKAVPVRPRRRKSARCAIAREDVRLLW